MSTDVTGRIGEQHAAYRKGLVLGLTMAEVGILIIFVLLLLIAFDYLRQAELFGQFRDKVAIEPGHLEKLVAAESKLEEIAKALGVDASEPSDDFARL